MHTWLELLAGDHIIEATAAQASLDDVAVHAALRRLGRPELVRMAIELVTARRRAAGKLRHAGRIMADTAGVEQATGSDVARHKAGRFAELAPRRLVDLCCGIGGDAMALAQ
ncbi:MAG: class I SAM-dependent methyltransferase, partial [Planctomycetes bacterium]|nr:class I SAM-dependent methyltransferase [Planctomycetota bacterium]